MFAEKMMRHLPPELAHKLTLKALAAGLGPTGPEPVTKATPVRLFGKEVRNRIGLAAGADKNGTSILGFRKMGFGFVTVGTITADPRHGNSGTRVWRIDSDALVNWMGLPSLGMPRVLDNIRAFRRGEYGQSFCVGASIKSMQESRWELAWMAASLAADVDYFEINASCPNVAHGNAQKLRDIAADVRTVVAAAGMRPVLVKLAPEIDEDIIKQTVTALFEAGAAGFIACNTLPFERRDLLGRHMPKRWPARNNVAVGGYSGPGLYPIACHMINFIRAVHGSGVILIGCGGIQGEETFEGMLFAGADAVQLYTGLARHGTAILNDMLGADYDRRTQS